VVYVGMAAEIAARARVAKKYIALARHCATPSSETAAAAGYDDKAVEGGTATSSETAWSAVTYATATAAPETTGTPRRKAAVKEKTQLVLVPSSPATTATWTGRGAAMATGEGTSAFPTAVKTASATISAFTQA
jgi:DNA-binding protein H-NS